MLMQRIVRALQRFVPAPTERPRRRPLAEDVEPRVLYSADVLPVGLPGDAAALGAELRVLDESPAAAMPEAAQHTARALVFVDAGVDDADALLADLRAADPTLEVIRLDADADGLAQIGAALAGRSDIDAIHLISHGSAGTLQLGNTLIDGKTLAVRADEFGAWQSALSADADILLYGCEVAGNAAGEAFVATLAALTGADVAASDDITGAGGDWALEHRRGTIEAQTLQARAWTGALGVVATSGDIDLNDNETNDQVETAVAMLNDGGWVAVWEDEDSNAVHATVYNADGSVRTPDFVVNQAVGRSTLPAVSSNGTDQIAVAFTNQASGNRDIYVRLFDLDGAPLSDDILVNAGETSGDQNYVSIAMNAAGVFVVTWEGKGTGDDNGIFARRFDSDGTPKGSVFLVNETSASDQHRADVAIAADGSFVVAWRDDATGGRVMARRFDALGAGSAESLVAANFLGGSPNNPSVAMDAAGRYVIAYEYKALIGSNHGIAMQAFNADGSLDGALQYVTSSLFYDNTHPDVTRNDANAYVVSWTVDGKDGDDEGIYFRAYQNGAPVTGETRANIYTNNSQQRSAIALSNSGKFVIAWDGERNAGNGDDASARTFYWAEAVAPNTAPVLDTAIAPALDAINEDAPAPVGAVGSLISSVVSLKLSGSGPENVSDTDIAPLTGIALVAVDASNGAWHYSIDNGANWIAIDPLSLSTDNALLLAANSQTRLHFTPDADYNGTLASAISFRAWDRTLGTNGGRADTTGNGGTTAYSTNIDTASLTVNAVNDPPDIGTNVLVISEGQSVVLSPAELDASDAENGPASLTYSVDAVSGGFFAWVSAPTVAITAFTQQNIIDGDVLFVHDGAEAAPTYTLTVVDGGGVGSPASPANIAFSNVNDAPQLADVALGYNAAQGAGAPVGSVGARITTLVTLSGSGSGPQNVTDPDTGAVAGIAISAADETHGRWHFSIDDGANWSLLDLAGLPVGEARLLAADGATRLYFEHTDVATGTFAGALTLYAWDGSSGTNGGSAVPTPGGGSTAFSVATDTVALNIVSSNQAPVLDTLVPITVPATEDAPAPSGAVGVPMSALVSLVGSSTGPQNVTDADASPQTGIAVVGTNTPNGTWWYSTDGGASWAQISVALSDTNALLLADDSLTRLYYQSTLANDFGTVANALDFKAWDQSAGSNGALGVNTTVGNSFSLATVSATLNIAAVNDLPSVDTNTLTLSEGATVVLGAGNLATSDVETGAAALSYTITAVSRGYFATTAAPTTPITTFSQADIDAGTIQFTHDGSEAAPSYSFTVSDGTDSVGPVAGVINYTATNDPPVLAASGGATLSLDEDSGVPSGPAGAPVSALVSLSGSGSGPQNVTDPDAGGLTGIAITAADTTNGAWYFSLDGGTNWNALGPVSATSARLLGAGSGVRIAFAPAPDYTGTTPAALRFVAWDQSVGSNADLADSTVGSAFSSVSDTLILIVRPVNDAPTVELLDIGAIPEDGTRRITQAELLQGAADIDGDALVATNLALASGSGSVVDNGDGTWTFTPTPEWNGAVSFAFEVEDGTTSVANTAALSVTPVDDTPTISGGADVSIAPGGAIGPMVFSLADTDTAASALTVSVTSSDPSVVSNAALVLSGSGATRTLTVAAGHGGGAGIATIVVTVSDGNSVSHSSFTVTAGAPSDPPPASPTVPAAPPPVSAATPDPADPVEAAPPVAEAPPPAPVPLPDADPAPTVSPTAPPPSELAVPDTFTAPVLREGGVTITLSGTDVLALLYTPDGRTSGLTLSGQVSTALREQQLATAFAQLREAADQDLARTQQTIGVTVVTGAGLTIGYVAWLIRGGVLLTSLLTSMPAWRLLDPMPILGEGARRRDEGDDDSLEALVGGADAAPPAPPPAEPPAEPRR